MEVKVMKHINIYLIQFIKHFGTNRPKANELFYTKETSFHMVYQFDLKFDLKFDLS